MATGYTHKIKDGITFKEYALTCARAFGALIEMRDDPIDAPIPDEFKPSDYHAKAIAASKERLALLAEMTNSECDNRAKAEYESELARHRKGIAEDVDLKAKYEAMLKQAKSYKAPSKEHEDYKKFMVEQIETSLDFDCHSNYHQSEIDALQLLSGLHWRNKEIEKAKANIAYHTKGNNAEIERTNGRTQWVRLLKQSLA